MSLLLPSSDSPVRALFDVRDLVVACSPENRRNLPTLQVARCNAARMFSGGGIKAVTSFVLRADGSVELMQFGPRGGKRTMWKFGVLA